MPEQSKGILCVYEWTAKYSVVPKEGWTVLVKVFPVCGLGARKELGQDYSGVVGHEIDAEAPRRCFGGFLREKDDFSKPSWYTT